MPRLIRFELVGAPIWLQVFSNETEDDALWRHDIQSASKLPPVLMIFICDGCSRPIYICRQSDPRICAARRIKPKPRMT